MNIIQLSVLVVVIGALTGLTNLIVQVLKQVIKFPTYWLVLAVAMILTIVAFFAYCAVFTITIFWYYVAAAIVVGILVAYAAMFGFDKLKQALIDAGILKE
jgi:hypothetical protein